MSLLLLLCHIRIVYFYYGILLKILSLCGISSFMKKRSQWGAGIMTHSPPET